MPSGAKSWESVIRPALNNELSVSTTVLGIPYNPADSHANLHATVSTIIASRTGLMFAAPAITGSPLLFLIIKPHEPDDVSHLKAPSTFIFRQSSPGGSHADA
jgi:hypothetical protein